MKRIIFSAIGALTLILIPGCVSTNLIPPYDMETMPPPSIYSDNGLNPFSPTVLPPVSTALPVLYATTRAPSNQDTKTPFYEDPPFYQNSRGHILRMGEAEIRMTGEGESWDDLIRFEEIRSTGDLPKIFVSSVRELAILDQSIGEYTEATDRDSDKISGEGVFTQRVNRLLEKSRKKEIFLFVHGYNSNFEEPLLMTSQFWHFTGYRGAFIAYSWPSFHKETAYLGDVDTALASARTFRIFLEYLARATEVQKIHIIGYSAGTRLVTQALNQITLLHHDMTGPDSREITKLGSLTLLASDMDRELFGTYLQDGLLKTLEEITIYVSEEDQLLKASHAVHSNPRLGEKWQYSMASAELIRFLRSMERLQLIDVSHAEGVNSRGGHFYFLDSPWVSSDFLMSLMTDISPEDRGLVRHPSLPYWEFPPDYPEISRQRIRELFTEREL